MGAETASELATRRVHRVQLEAFATQVLYRAGLRVDEADSIAGALVEANLRGVDGHGVLRLVQYVSSIRRGDINLAPEVTVNRRGATAMVDADGGYGFTPSRLAMQVAITIAGELGAGAVTVRRSHHFGIAALYALQAAEAGCVGIATTNTMAVMPAPGGRQAVVGNDPISIAVPREGREPIVVDLALSEASWGKISLAAARNQPIPLGWAYDREGIETTSPGDALDANLLVPVGGSKGFALAALLELVAGGLAGAPVGPDADGHAHRDGGCGHLFIALNPDAFCGAELFAERVEQLAQTITNSPTTTDQKPRLPGTRSATTRAERLQRGVPIPDDVRGRLNELANDLGARPL